MREALQEATIETALIMNSVALASQEFYDFRAASHRFGGNERAFDGACNAALLPFPIAPNFTM
jgi:hypothetical protein